MRGLAEAPAEHSRRASGRLREGTPAERSLRAVQRAGSRAITVVVADDEPARRATCIRMLEPDRGIRVLGESATAEVTLEHARLNPRILLIDANLAMREGFALLPMFRRRSPNTRVIVLTGQTSGAALLPALALGAQGYLNRRSLRPLLPKAIRKVDAGEPWISRRLLPRIIEKLMRLSDRR